MKMKEEVERIKKKEDKKPTTKNKKEKEMVERGGVELLPNTNCSKKLKHSRVSATRSEEKKKEGDVKQRSGMNGRCRGR